MKKLITFIFTGLAIAPSFGQLDRSVQPKAAAAPTFNIPESTIFTLDNGITVILSEDHKIPRVSFDLEMGSDPSLEKDKTGLSDLAGSLILSGTTKSDKDKLDEAIDMMGASFDAGSDNIFASGLSKHKEKMIEILTEVLNYANFPQSEFDRIKKQSASSLTMAKSDADQIASNVLHTVDFTKNHPYGEVMTDETLENITRDDVVNYFKNTFTPDGAYLVVVGDITADQLKSLLSNSIAQWKGGTVHHATYDVKNTNKGPRVIFVKKPGAVQSVIKVTFPFQMKPGDADQVKLTLANQILGGGTFEAKLMQNLREDKAYTYGCYSSVNVDRYGSYFTTSGSFRNEVTDSALVQILGEIDSMKLSSSVSQAQLDLAKASMTGSFSRSLERPQTIARFALSIIRNNLDKDYYKNYLKKIEDVTLADVQAMSEKFLDVDHAFIVVVGNEDIAEKLKVFDGDGKIEYLDAYGNPEAGFKKSDLTLTQILENNVLAVTQSKTIKEAEAKVAKIKSMKQEVLAKPVGAPVTFDMITYFQAPNKEAMVINFNGSMMQREFFDGKKGGTEASAMAGGKSTELSAEEIAEKNSVGGVLPELNYEKNKVNISVLGIKQEKGVKYYVLEIKSKDGITQNFYNGTTFLKERVYSSNATDDGETNEATIDFKDFKDASGLLMPYAMDQQLGGMTLNSEVKNIEINKTIEGKVFEK